MRRAGFKSASLKQLLWQAARAPNEREFEAAMKEMREINVECVEWLLRTASPIYWAEAFFPGRRFGHLTSNIAESLNA